MSEPLALVEHFFRHEFGRLGAVLTRSLDVRRLDCVEDVVLPENVPARYPGWHVVIGELHFRLGRHSAAERAWREALRFTTARADREFLRRRLGVCRPDGGEPATE